MTELHIAICHAWAIALFYMRLVDHVHFSAAVIFFPIAVSLLIYAWYGLSTMKGSLDE